MPFNEKYFASIQASVGKHRDGRIDCFNLPPDVKTVVKLLNLIPRLDGGTKESRLKGSPTSSELYVAIRQFQSTQNQLGRYTRLSVDGHVDPGGETLRRLNIVSYLVEHEIQPDELNLSAPEPFDIAFPPDTPARLMPLVDSGWRFAKTDETSLEVGIKLSAGGFKLRDPDNTYFNLGYLGLGAGIGPSVGFGSSGPEWAKNGPEWLRRILNLELDGPNLFIKNLGSVLKASISGGALLDDGAILASPQIGRALSARHLNTGYIVIVSGDVGAFLVGAKGALVFFGVDWWVPLVGGVANPTALILGGMIQGRVPLPRAVGMFRKVSGGTLGGGIYASTCRVTRFDYGTATD